MKHEKNKCQDQVKFIPREYKSKLFNLIQHINREAGGRVMIISKDTEKNLIKFNTHI